MKSIFFAVCLWLFLASPALADYQYGLDAFNKGEHHKAYTRWRKAAMKGDKHAQFQLARLYQTGIGAPKSPKLAYIWYAIAAHSGIVGADQDRDAMKNLLTSGDLNEADWTLQEYIKTHAPSAAKPASESTSTKQPEESITRAGHGNKDQVREVQEMLARLGYRPGPPDGKQGKRTTQAIKAFQKLKGLPSTGEISTQLRANLEQVVPPATADTLFDAARNGNPTAVIAILRQGVDINSRNPDGLTALHLACANGHPTTSSTLLDAGADINARTNSGSSPLDLARPTENRELLQLLKERGAV